MVKNYHGRAAVVELLLPPTQKPPVESSRTLTITGH